MTAESKRDVLLAIDHEGLNALGNFDGYGMDDLELLILQF